MINLVEAVVCADDLVGQGTLPFVDMVRWEVFGGGACPRRPQGEGGAREDTSAGDGADPAGAGVR
jgi:hypothetical protein